MTVLLASVTVPVPAHLGDLHAYETALLALLAFGPFAVLAVVIAVLRRRDAEVEGSGDTVDEG